MLSIKYKVKIKEGYEDDFRNFLNELNVKYKETSYTPRLLIWGVFLSKKEEIEKIKNLPYVEEFGVMPNVTLS